MPEYIDKLSKATGLKIRFAADIDVTKLADAMSSSYAHAPLDKVLDLMALEYGLVWRVEEGAIVLARS